MLLKPRYFLISCGLGILLSVILFSYYAVPILPPDLIRSEEHTSELQSR